MPTRDTVSSADAELESSVAGNALAILCRVSLSAASSFARSEA
jgi:hypothetical protein